MSAPVASIIRQPLGPSSNGFGAQQTSNNSTSMGPPPADAESALRRHNTVSTPRHHQPSASISSTPAASSAYHGSKAPSGSFRLRSGSLSSSNPDPGLVRKGSGRASVRKEEAVIESTEEGTTESGTWGKGLSRQSSLPSRRGYNPISTPTEPVPVRPVLNPPPRPPRRIANDAAQQPSHQPTHAPSHSLSSLTAFSPPAQITPLDPVKASVSRTQSLRAQAKHPDPNGLGRSSSMRTPGEHHRPLQAIPSAISPPSQPNTPHNPFTPPSPPPLSSAAAFPSYTLPQTEVRSELPAEKSDLRRHQSLTQGYGSSSRVRDRLERSPAALTLQQRDTFRRVNSRSNEQEEPPTSPIGHSVWSPSRGGDDGWSRPSTQHIQEAFQAMHLGVPPTAPADGQLSRGNSNDVLRQPLAQIPPGPNRQQSLADEPSWVAGLVGHADHLSPQPVRTASAPGWQHRDTYIPQQGQPVSPWPNQPFLGQPFALPLGPVYNLDPRQQGSRGPIHSAGPYGALLPNYLGQALDPSYPSPPNTALLPSEDVNVIELAKSKGLNPATFDCRPQQARFFVIKSYTEDDVQKSLKHGIWSSTVLGNKRLDTAFRESSDQMPIYLFFSVNGSRHFCGVAQMLTAVDETQSANVWSENNKWKGIFKVKWIFVRDVPTFALRHIRLLNTPEQKPITNSRDTQELHYEAGCEVLQIFLDHQSKSRTSLLQDFAYYERLSANRPPSAPGLPSGAAPPSSTPPAFHAPNPAYQQAYPIPMGIPGQSGIPPVPSIPARFR